MANSYQLLMQSEHEHMDKVYQTLDDMVRNADDDVNTRQEEVLREAYEDQEAFIPHSLLGISQDRRREITRLVERIYSRPYFAHVELTTQGEPGSDHYYLSDSENLDRLVEIRQDGNLVPFKKDIRRPILEVLLRCYQSRNGEPIDYTYRDGERVVLQPEFICDDDIANRHLKSAVQLYPAAQMDGINADELLAKKLADNRDDPALRNIIATLQNSQFQIIATDIDVSFVVQGCAGSGKSQCLLHRLFYLRDYLSDEGWTHVLLITPTQLFRNYSAELVRRYQLSDIDNCSLAELYRLILEKYDTRFRGRQYEFVLTEEYLPDGYLQKVYSRDTIVKIDGEISAAISKYVQMGCDALGITVPGTIDSRVIAKIISGLDEELASYDAREAELQEELEYAETKNRYETLRRTQEDLEKKERRRSTELENLKARQEQLQKYLGDLSDAENNRSEWLRQREQRINTALKNLNNFSAAGVGVMDAAMPSRYAQTLYNWQDLTGGKAWEADEQYLSFLDAFCESEREAKPDFVGNRKPEQVERTDRIRVERMTTELAEIQEQLRQISMEIDQCDQWLHERAGRISGIATHASVLRSELERARYYLSRLESTVFEQEVWDALTPIKEQFHIETVHIEQKDNHQKRSRILYKSDLMFYVKIYAAIHPRDSLPEFRLICIDEGQDFHKADYDLLHMLYPEAVLNVFGDTAQVLHSSCGIHDWRKETGIQDIYTLDCNYRNTGAVVKFCNERFGTTMGYIGKIDRYDKPLVVETNTELSDILNVVGIIVIVKGADELAELCRAVNRSAGDFEFLDTRAIQVSGAGIPCYTIYAAKGLEFADVLVYARGMTLNQRVVACTRAMSTLYYYE